MLLKFETWISFSSVSDTEKGKGRMCIMKKNSNQLKTGYQGKLHWAECMDMPPCYQNNYWRNHFYCSKRSRMPRLFQPLIFYQTFFFFRSRPTLFPDQQGPRAGKWNWIPGVRPKNAAVWTGGINSRHFFLLPNVTESLLSGNMTWVHRKEESGQSHFLILGHQKYHRHRLFHRMVSLVWTSGWSAENMHLWEIHGNNFFLINKEIL